MGGAGDGVGPGVCGRRPGAGVLVEKAVCVGGAGGDGDSGCRGGRGGSAGECVR